MAYKSRGARQGEAGSTGGEIFGGGTVEKDESLFNLFRRHFWGGRLYWPNCVGIKSLVQKQKKMIDAQGFKSGKKKTLEVSGVTLSRSEGQSPSLSP